MASFAHDRENTLSQDELAASARKCLEIIGDVSKYPDMEPRDSSFVREQQHKADSVTYRVTERQLQWLRDIKDRCL